MSGIVLDVTVNDDGTVNLKSLANALGKVGDESDKAGKKGKKSLDSISDSAKKMSSAITRYATDIRAQLGMALGSAGMGMLVKQGLAYNATLESISAQFEVITGSSAEAAAIMKDLVDFAAKTPFELVEVANSAKILRAFGIEGNDALRIVGDAAAAAQRPLEEVAMVFGRIKSGAFGEAFMRLAEMGIATREMLEGKGLQFDRSGSYKGSAADALAAVQAIVNERFGGMMKKQSTMWSGLMSTLRDAWNGLIGKITGPLFDKLKPKIAELTTFINGMADSPKAREWGQTLADGAGKAIDAIKDSASWIIEHKDGLTTTLATVADIGIAIGVTVGLMKTWIGLQTALNVITKTNPYVFVASVLVGIGAAIGEMIHRTIGWQKEWEVLKGGIVAAGKVFGDMALAVGRFATGNFSGAAAAIKGMGDAMYYVADEAGRAAKNASAFTQSMMGAAGLAMPGVPYMLDRKHWSPPSATPAGGGGGLADATSDKATRRLEKATEALKNYTAAKLAYGESAYVGKYDALGHQSAAGPYTMEELQTINNMIKDMIPIEQDLHKGMPRPSKEDIAAWNRLKDAGITAMTALKDSARMLGEAIADSIGNAVLDSKAKLIDLAGVAKSIFGMLLSFGIRYGIAALAGPGSFLSQAMGFKAAGGPVQAGGLYVVGERGPELFAPRQSGTIIPNHALAGAGGGGILNLSINVGGSRRDAAELEAVLVPVIERWVDRRRINLARSR